MRNTLVSRIICKLVLALSIICSLSLLSNPQFVAEAAMTMPASESGAETGPATLPKNLTAEEARDLLATMPDSEVRKLLLLELDSSANKEKQAEEEDFLGRVEKATRRAQRLLRQMVASIKDLPKLPTVIWSQVTDGGLIPTWRLIYEFALSLLAGFLLEKAYRKVVWDSQKLAASIFTPSLSFASKLGFVGLSSLMELLAISIFAFGAVLTASFLITSSSPQLMVVSLLWAIVGIRVITLLARMLLAPKQSRFRLAGLEDTTAKASYKWLLWLAIFWVTMKWVSFMVDEYSVPVGLDLLVGLIMGMLFVGLLIAIVLKARDPVAHKIYAEAGDRNDATTLRHFFAQKWHILVIAYILAIWLLSMLLDLSSGGEGTGGRGILSILILFAVPLADSALQSLMKKMFKPEGKRIDDAFEETTDVRVGADGELQILPGETRQKHISGKGYERMAINYGRMLLGLAVFLLVFEIWEIDLRGMTEQVVGTRFATASFEIGIILLVAYVIWGLTKTAIAQKIGVDADVVNLMPGEDEPGAGVGKSRLETLLPLYQKFIFIALLVMVVMVSLSALGVNIGPLIAGAGVIGIAIGFGAQKLVQDVISGVFFLIDDAFRVGEYIEAGGLRGSVERISIRSLRLRHHLGPVQTIPFSGIQTVKNHSRDFVIMKLKFRVPFDTDIEKVRKIIKRVGQELLKNEELGPDFLGPLKSQGVLSVEDDALLMRMKFTAKPGKQWLIRREAYRRVKEELEKAGIEFANKQVTVHIPGSDSLSEEQRRQIAGSAAQVAIEKEPQGEDKKDEDSR